MKAREGMTAQATRHTRLAMVLAASEFSVTRYLGGTSLDDNVSYLRPAAANAAQPQLSIPRRIVQTGSTFADAIRWPQQREWIQRWAKLNPEYEYNFFGDRDALRFVVAHGSADEIRAYKSLATGSQRADLFRILYLRTAGGVYADLDQEPRLPLREVIQPATTVLAGRWWPFEFLVFQPGHRILNETARIMTANIMRQWRLAREGAEKRCRTPHSCVILVTGPPAYHEGVRAATLAGGCTRGSPNPNARLCKKAVDPTMRAMVVCDGDGGNVFNTWACNTARHWDCRNSRPTPEHCQHQDRKHYSKHKGQQAFFVLPEETSPSPTQSPAQRWRSRAGLGAGLGEAQSAPPSLQQGSRPPKPARPLGASSVQLQPRQPRQQPQRQQPQRQQHASPGKRRRELDGGGIKTKGHGGGELRARNGGVGGARTNASTSTRTRTSTSRKPGPHTTSRGLLAGASAAARQYWASD